LIFIRCEAFYSEGFVVILKLLRFARNDGLFFFVMVLEMAQGFSILVI
jgi:hypothetical protein